MPTDNDTPAPKSATLFRLYSLTFARAKETRERLGQALFNNVEVLRPDLAEEMRGTQMDPFLVRDAWLDSDPKFARAIEFIESRWNAETSP